MKPSILNLSLIENLRHPNPHMPFSEFIDLYDSYADNGFPSHWHHEFEMQIIIKGSAQYTVNGASHLVKAGSGIYIAPESIHSSTVLELGTMGYNIIVHPKLLTDLLHSINCDQYASPLLNREPDAFVLKPTSKESSRILQQLNAFYNSNAGDAYELQVMEGLLKIWRNLLALFHKTVLKSPMNNSAQQLREHRLRTMMDFIHLHYSEDLSVQTIAGSANISKSECFRCFSDLSKTTPTDYLNRIRMMQAGQLLLTTNDSISDICFSVGFNSTSYFSKEFKKMYGVSPKEYRQEVNSL